MPYNIVLTSEKHCNNTGVYFIEPLEFPAMVWKWQCQCKTNGTSVGVTGCVFVPVQLYCRNSFDVSKATFRKGNLGHPFPAPCNQAPALQASAVP